ncbi:hypothetical protein ACFXTH_001298 [Malus domestica]
MFKFFLGGGGNQEKTNDVNGGRGDPLDLQALPEGCTATVVSLTTPRDTGTMSSVSRSFRSAAESDVVWDKFLPLEIHTIMSSSSPLQTGTRPIDPLSPLAPSTSPPSKWFG